jgi:mono/diheme cytochrome c family protein
MRKHGWLALAAMTLGSMALGVGTAQAQAVDTTKAEAEPDSAQMTPAIIDAGRKIFHSKGTCHACHGDKLRGGPIAPALLGPKWRHIDGTFSAIVDRIDHGLAGTLMVARPGGISQAEVYMVAAYVWAVSHAKAKP